MKKTLILLLVVLVILTFSATIIGCKEEAPAEDINTEVNMDETEETTEEEESQEAVDEETAPLELTWLQHWEGEIGADLLDRMEAKFAEGYPGLTIKRENLPYEQLFDKMMMLAQANELPDVMMMQGFWPPSLAPIGALEPLTERLESEGLMDDFTFVNYFQGEVWNVYVYGGPTIPFCNTRMFKEAGVDYPTTWEGFIDIAKALTDPSINQYASAAEMGDAGAAIFYWYGPLLAAFGGDFVDEDGNFIYNSNAGVKALEYLGTLNSESVLLPGTLSNTEQNKREAFSNEIIAMEIEGVWEIGIQEAMGTDFPYEAITNPKGPGSEGTTGTFMIGTGLAMSTNSQNKDVGWEFIKFLTIGEGNKMWMEERANLSAYKPHLELPYVQEHPALKVFAQQALDPNNIPLPAVEGTMNWITILATEIQKYLNGDKTAQEALDDSITNYEESLARS